MLGNKIEVFKDVTRNVALLLGIKLESISQICFYVNLFLLLFYLYVLRIMPKSQKIALTLNPEIAFHCLECTMLQNKKVRKRNGLMSEPCCFKNKKHDFRWQKYSKI